MMTHEGLLESFEEAGGVDALLTVAKSKVPEDTKIKSLCAIFHMTMDNDNIRIKVCNKALKELTTIINSKTSSEPIKNQILKTLVNITLSDGLEENFIREKTIAPLLKMLINETSPDLRDNICMALENLASNAQSNEEIRKCGGVQTSLDFLSSIGNDKNLQEKAAKLIARFAINSKARKEYQDNDSISLLNSILGKIRDPNVKQALSMATNSLSVPHYESEGDIKEEEEIEKFSAYDLGSESGEENDAFYDNFMSYAHSDSEEDFFHFSETTIDSIDCWDDMYVKKEKKRIPKAPTKN